MDTYWVCVFLIFTCTRTESSKPDLQEQHLESIDPANDYQYDNLNKEQDKRTIFKPHRIYGLAKHVGMHPLGFKYVLGHGGVDFKYVPVPRPFPVRSYGYRYPYFHLHQTKNPTAFKPARKPAQYGSWRPIFAPPLKPAGSAPHPVIPPLVPIPPQVLHKPWELEGWAHHRPVTGLKPVASPSIPAVGIQPVTPVKPVLPAPPVFVKPAAPSHPVSFVPTQIRPTVQLPVAPPLVATPAFYEVSRPNLPVLPLGSSFPSSVLPSFPGTFPVPHYKFIGSPPLVSATHPIFPQPVLPYPSQLLPQPHPISPHSHPVSPVFYPPQPVFPQSQPQPQPVFPPPQPFLTEYPQVAPQPPQLLPQPQPMLRHPPGTVVDYHGTRSFISGQLPFALPQIPTLPQTPVNAVQPISPPYFHHSHIPQVPVQVPHEQHDVQVPLVPTNHPNFFQNNFNHNFIPQHIPNVVQQQPPTVESKHQVFQQFTPHNHVDVFQQQLPVDNNQHHGLFQNSDNVVQQQLPNNQPTTIFSEQFPVENSNQDINVHNNIQQEHHNVIQPGESDLQIPSHLPNHPNFFSNNHELNSDNFQSAQQQELFTPSLSLEAPYQKKK